MVFRCGRTMPDFSKSLLHFPGKGSHEETTAKPHYGFEEFLFNRTYRRPNLELIVDFTELMFGNQTPLENKDLIGDSLQIWLGFTENIDDVTNATSPVSLFPGTDLLSVVDFSIRQRLQPRALATLGFEVNAPYL